MTGQDFYSYIVLPGLAAIQIAAAYWVYKAQNRHNDAMTKAVNSFREYENDLRNQLADLRKNLDDQKGLVDTATKVVPLLKSSYEEVRNNRDEIFRAIKDELETAKAEIARKETAQLQEVDEARADPALTTILSTIVKETSVSREQLVTLTAAMQSFLEANSLPSANYYELLLRDSRAGIGPSYAFSDNGDNSKEDAVLRTMAYKLKYLRIKTALHATIETWNKANNMSKAEGLTGRAPYDQLWAQCAAQEPALVAEYPTMQTDVINISLELAPNHPAA